MAIRWQDGKVEYAGAVLADRERNYHDDSDFYALVWDGERITSIQYDTTRYGGGGNCVVDATDEVKAAANRWLEELALTDLISEAERRARVPQRGRRVKFVKAPGGKNAGRAQAGDTGTVFWYGEGHYFGPVPRYRGGWSCRGPMRVGVKLENGTEVWGAASLVEVIDPEPPNRDALRAQAKRAHGFWHYCEARVAAHSGMFVL
jgi:hypothetical protein